MCMCFACTKSLFLLRRAANFEIVINQRKERKDERNLPDDQGRNTPTPTCLGERPDRRQGAGDKAENRGKSVTSNKEKKSGAHFCGAVSGFAGYYFNDCRSCVDVIRKCGEYGCNLCCYCDECCAWNGSISQGRKIT